MFSKLNKLLNESKQLFVNTWRINRIVWKEKKRLVTTLYFLFLFTSLSSLAQSGATAVAINELINIQKTGEVSTIFYYSILALILAIFIPLVLTKAADYLDYIYYMYVEETFELLCLKKLGDIDIALHENPKYRDLFNKVTEHGIFSLREFGDRQFYVFETGVAAVFSFFSLAFFDWKIFFILFAGTLPELIAGIYYGQRQWSLYSSKGETKRKFWNLKDHFINVPSLIELRLYQNIEYFYDIIKRLFLDFRSEQYKNNAINFKNQLMAAAVSQTALTATIIYYFFQAVNGSIGIGTLTFVLAMVQTLRASFSRLFSLLARQYQDSLFASDVFSFLEIKPVIKKPEKGIVLNKKLAPEIIFENVTFSYPDTKAVALKNFSLEIKPGEKIALVGLNGAGKTTFVKLLCRFYDPTEGRILINGHNLREIDLESWYHLLGAVFQDYSNYHLTVKESIAVGRTGDKPDIEKVKDAAKAGEADIFIEKWEKAYEQTLGKEFTEGVEPSIGQWQKLALARTFYRDPKVMILDEPTSSIDAESEAKIFERIDESHDERTVIMISHRFSTVRNANKIIVIKDGEKIEEGSHKKLMKQQGAYAELFTLQAENYSK